MIHPQAQKMLIAYSQMAYKPRAKDIINIQDFTMKTHVDMIYQGYHYRDVSSKCDGLWPVIGNENAVMRFNLVNIGTSESVNKYLTPMDAPVENDGYFSMNGTSQYFRTGLDMTTYYTLDTSSPRYGSLHMSYVSRSAVGSATNRWEIGVDTPTPNQGYIALSVYYTSGGLGRPRAYLVSTPPAQYATSPASSKGVFVVNRNTTSSLNGNYNQSDIGSPASNLLANALYPTISAPIMIGRWLGSLYTNKAFAGASIGFSLTNDERLSLAKAFEDLDNNK